MRLYYSATSPYVRKVMVVLHETDQLKDVQLIPASGTPLKGAEQLLPKNPLGKVPALERPDGPTLYDSRVICRFLNARAGGNLYPTAHEWETLTLEATGDGILDAALLMTYETRLRPEDKRFDDWVEGQWAKIERSLAALSSRWMSHLNGPLDIGQIAVACALDYVDFRHGARGWSSRHPELAAWRDDFVQRPSMQHTGPVE